jgi:hypothetical protein
MKTGLPNQPNKQINFMPNRRKPARTAPSRWSWVGLEFNRYLLKPAYEQGDVKPRDLAAYVTAPEEAPQLGAFVIPTTTAPAA